MGQISFSDAEYAGKRKKTRREVSLEEMELVFRGDALSLIGDRNLHHLFHLPCANQYRGIRVGIL